MFPALAWSVKDETMPDESPAKHKFIPFKGFLFFQSEEKFQTLDSISVPNCQIADVAVFPQICLEKAANVRKGKTVFYPNELLEVCRVYY